MPSARDTWPDGELCWAPHRLADGTELHCQRWPRHDGAHRVMTFDHEWEPDSGEACKPIGPLGCGRRPLGRKDSTA